MLTNLSLKNIKSFKNSSNLKIAPLTLIYGSNSSGKSSLWKFLITLKLSLRRGSGNNFINFDRSYDFANSKTISFNPNRSSEFGFQFDDLTQSDSFKDHIKTVSKNIEKDVPIFLRLSQKIDENTNENSGLKFIFSFLNINEHDEKDIVETDDDKKYEDILKSLTSKGKLTSAEKTLVQSIKEIQKNNKLLIKSKKELKQLKKEIASKTKDQNVILNHLRILKDDKLFADYHVVALENIPSRMRAQAQAIGDREVLNNMRKRSEQEILGIIREHFKNFKFEVAYNLEKDLKERYFKTSEKTKVIFDFVGPNGPQEIKSRIDNPLRYLFIPIKISSDKFFWEEHFNFLQIIKKIIKKNKTNKNMSEPEIYKKYFQEELNNKEAYYEVMKGLDSSKIPEIQNTFDRTLEAMSAPFEKFCKIMTDDMRTQILEGTSFMPSQYFYGGEIYKGIFRTLVKGFIDIAIQTDIDGIVKSFNISEDEAIEFLLSYAKFTKYSYENQISNLFNFPDNLRNYIEHGNIDRGPGMGMGARFHPRLITSTLHNTPEHRKRIIDLLEKINLPFNIETQTDRDGEIRVSFTNKKISNSQKDIPIEQSGNALKSIIVLLNELALSENRTLIIEEPENKIHPNIQGNLIELIVEIIKKNSNNIIIETHSEHFILRIQKLIREKKLNPNFVSINYIYLDDNGEGSKIDQMHLNDDGKFENKWRHGFFNERLNEL